MLRTTLCAALAHLALAAAPSAQVPTQLTAVHRAGQTFLTWKELSGAGKRYRIYRATTPMASAVDLKNADFLGEVDDRTSRNQGRSLASGLEKYWIVHPGGNELAIDTGLFVHTIEVRTTRAYYAVTSVQAGGENRTLVPGSNATPFGLFERPSRPEPVLQSAGPEGELYAHWVSDRDTPFFRAQSLWPSRGFNYLLQRGTASGPRGLIVRLHAAGQVYTQGWPQRFEVPDDVDILSPSDLMPYTSWSFWFGSHGLLPGTATGATSVWNYTQQRVLTTLDWVISGLGAEHDPERVYVIGGSMGAIGGMYLVNEAPERFAAALLRNGLYDLEVDDYRNPDLFQTLFGSFALDLPSGDGLTVLQRTNAVFMAQREPREDWPILRTLSGRNDETVGWRSAVRLFQGLAAAERPAVHYFDERTHNPNGHWRDLERTLLARTFATRRDRPSLRFLECSLDDDPGNGERTDGTPVGTINGTIDFDARTATSENNALTFEVYVRDEGRLDDAPLAHALAALAPARTGPFAPASDEAVWYTLHEDGRLVDEHVLFADAHGRVRTPRAPLATTRRTARFERGAPRTQVPFFLGAAPLAGDSLQAVLRGTPGQAWRLVLVPGGPLSAVRFWLVRSGTFDASGRVDLTLPLPRTLPSGAWIYGRARIGASWTPIESVVVQDAGGWGPQQKRRS